MQKWIIGMALAIGLSGAARAADHRDGPAAAGDSTTDITDVYAWMSAAGDKVYLVMDVEGAPMGATATTKFSNTALFAFHITSGMKFQMTTDEQLIICSFSADMNQKLSCWGPNNEYVTG